MVLLVLGFLVFWVVRGVMSALASLRGLPRSNADWVWY